MDRRKFLKIASIGFAGTASSIIILSTCFKPNFNFNKTSKCLFSREDRNHASSWIYTELDPNITADLAYKKFEKGGCMYGVFNSIISPLGKKIGEPYKSFPHHMMKYGSGGVADYGSICGALNGVAAAIGLFVRRKENRNYLIADLFSWYEKTELPKYIPKTPILDGIVAQSVSNSVLCHVSSNHWVKVSGFKMYSKEQTERCRRLTADVARKAITMLNDYFNDFYFTSDRVNNKILRCIKCHQKGGKLRNSRGQMNCTSCHSLSLGHKVFADIHYKMIKKVSD